MGFFNRKIKSNLDSQKLDYTDRIPFFYIAILPIAFLIVAGLVCIGLYRWDFSRNRGYNFGYYGDLNRMSNAISSIPGLGISDSWANCDITLEEFGFTVTNLQGSSIKISFGERDPIRKLSGEPMLLALKREIGIKAPSWQTGK